MEQNFKLNRSYSLHLSAPEILKSYAAGTEHFSKYQQQHKNFQRILRINPTFACLQSILSDSFTTSNNAMKHKETSNDL